jgi:photosystem II stability/assembly factor-like uncharacterized protein
MRFIVNLRSKEQPMIRFSARTISCVVSALAVACLGFPTASSEESPKPAIPPDAYEIARGLHFREIGPASQGGRIDSIAVAQGDPNTFFIGTATGGLWKTTNAGNTFVPVFDQEPVLTIGAVAIAPSDPSVVWVGTGEPNNRQSSSWGNGAYKSMDGGRSWVHVGLEQTQSIGRIVIDPTNPETVYVAALGHLWGPNPERGLYKTTDGGNSWSKVLFIDQDTGVVDVVINPRSSNTLYAASYQRRRTAWGFNGGGPGSAIYKTSDGGRSWKRLTEGLPEDSNSGRIGLAIYEKKPNIIYALIQNAKGGVFRSEDDGQSWKQTSSTGSDAYFGQVRIDPNHDSCLWVLEDDLLHSSDGGKTFDSDRGGDVHSDFHDLWIDPQNSDHIIAATDGGIWTSEDGGRAWDFNNALAIGQVYQVSTGPGSPYQICAGFQDNGAWCGPSRNRSAEGIVNSDWHHVLTGDAFFTLIDPRDPNIIYSEAQDGKLMRLDLQSHEWAPIRPLAKAGEATYRFAWDSPLLISSHDSQTLYFAANTLFKSTDRGDSWVPISPDLTTNIDRTRLPIMGKLPDKNIQSLNFGVQSFPCISAVAESPLDPAVLWVGTEDGNLQLTHDGGKSWQNISSSLSAVPHGTWVSSIELSKDAPGVAYVTFDGHRNDDFHPYIFRTDDSGHTWKPIVNGIPNNGGTVRVIRADPYNPNLLFLGTEYGGYVSFDQGQVWQTLGMGLPGVPVDDISIQRQQHDLILGTHGRSLWVLDDIRPLEELQADTRTSDLQLFDLAPATEWRIYIDDNGFEGQRIFRAPNPPNGAVIDYYLNKEVDKNKEVDRDHKVRIVIRNSRDEIVRELDGTSRAGINRVEWDLRWQTPAEPADLQIFAMRQGFFFYRVLPHLGMPGPFVEPGDYKVTISIGDRTSSKSLTVVEDPTVILDGTERSRHQQLLMDSFHLYSEAIRAQKGVVAVEGPLNSAMAAWTKIGTPPKEIEAFADTVAKKVTDLRNQLLGPKVRDPVHPPSPALIARSAELLYGLEAHTAAPTRTQEAQFAELRLSLAEASRQLGQLRDEDLPALNSKMRQAGMAYIVIERSELDPANSERK